MPKLAPRCILFAVGVLLALALLVAAPIAPAIGRVPRLRTVKVTGRLGTVGCMSPSLCVAGGLTKGQGLPAEVVVLRRGRAIRSLRLKSYGLAPAISCPSSRGCFALASTISGAFLVGVSPTGVFTVHTLRAPSGVMFESISCIGAGACEVAGENIDGGIVIASWDGRRLETIREVSIPDGSGFGNYVPVVSCAGAWCEVSDNIYVPNQESANLYQLYVTTVHEGKPVGSQSVPGYLGSVSCGASRDCYALLENYSVVGSSGGTFLAPMRGGQVGTPRPVDIALAALACRGERCIAAGSNRLVTFSGGQQTSSRTVAGVQAYLGVTLGPGGLLAAIGSGARGGSVFTIG